MPAALGMRVRICSIATSTTYSLDANPCPSSRADQHTQALMIVQMRGGERTGRNVVAGGVGRRGGVARDRAFQRIDGSNGPKRCAGGNYCRALIFWRDLINSFARLLGLQCLAGRCQGAQCEDRRSTTLLQRTHPFPALDGVLCPQQSLNRLIASSLQFEDAVGLLVTSRFGRRSGSSQ
jgi:hypothetical protein